MKNNEDRLKQYEFIHMLKENKLNTPNDFTIGMGKLIKKAREDKNISQAELAKLLNRRQATISDIENGKSEIGILTLVQFAIELDKPISYFFPESLLKEWVVDIKSPFQHRMLELSKGIELLGDPVFTLKIMEVIVDYFEELYDTH